MTPSSGALSSGIILMCVGLLAACNNALQEDTAIEPEAEVRGPDGLPMGTVEIGPSNYMIPLEHPVNDCKAYRNHAPGRMVAQVVYYRHPDGEFSPVRKGAICE